jgi:hypothetical protein
MYFSKKILARVERKTVRPSVPAVGDRNTPADRNLESGVGSEG